MCFGSNWLSSYLPSGRGQSDQAFAEQMEPCNLKSPEKEDPPHRITCREENTVQESLSTLLGTERSHCQRHVVHRPACTAYVHKLQNRRLPSSLSELTGD